MCHRARLHCIVENTYLTSNNKVAVFVCCFLMRVLFTKKLDLIAVLDEYVHMYHHKIAETTMLKQVAHLNQGLLPVSAHEKHDQHMSA